MSAVVTGLERLLRDGPGSIGNPRLGLITNHTGVTRTLEHATDAMLRAGFRLAALFAPVLVLHGVTQPPILKREIVHATVRLLGLHGATFERIFALREQGEERPLDDREANELFAAYLAQIERVIEAVDRLGATGNT